MAGQRSGMGADAGESAAVGGAVAAGGAIGDAERAGGAAAPAESADRGGTVVGAGSAATDSARERAAVAGRADFAEARGTHGAERATGSEGSAVVAVGIPGGGFHGQGLPGGGERVDRGL